MITFLILLLPMLLAVPVGTLLVQVLAAGRSFRTAGASTQEPSLGQLAMRMAVLVPAHDEADLIASTVTELRRELAPGDRLLVVADNCSDDTASLAAAAGAEAIERRDLARRGKGYALDFGVRHLSMDPPDVVLVVDADCSVSRGSLLALAAAAGACGRPAQSAYMMHPPRDPSPKERIAAFAWRVKTWVRPMGMRALGLPCGLSGTGMAFPWAVVSRLPLASSALAEDVELGIAATRAGFPPFFAPWVEVSSAFPETREASKTQRRRWEQGSLAAIGRYCLPLLADTIRRGRPELLAMALDLAVPPLALLSMLVAGGTLVAVSANYFAGTGSPLMYLAIVAPGAALAVAVGIAWFRFGRECLSIWDLAYAPWYAASKIGMYLSVVLSRRPEWIKTKRR